MNDKFMKVALKQAQIAFNKGDVPVGAVIVKNSRIIARAYNKREEKKDATCHAEILAIKKACRYLNDWRLSGCTMYVTLEPCQMCMGAIKQSRMKEVIYGTKNINENEEAVLSIHDQALADECSAILKSFFQNMRN
jgi:tRNA(adenine34) deaminase